MWCRTVETVSPRFRTELQGFTLSIFLFREYVSSKTINKVIKVHDRIFCCMAGSLADAQAVIKAAKFHLSFHRSHTSQHSLSCFFPQQ